MIVSAQKLLHGNGFDNKHMLEKAQREFFRLKNCQNILIIYDHVINFAVTIALLVDWTFHLRLADKQQWANKNTTHFVNWIRSQSDQVTAFIDISNECKHANRKYANFVVKELLVYLTDNFFGFPEEIIASYQTKGFTMTGSRDNQPILVFFLPIVQYNDRRECLYDVAEMALAWWENFDPDNATPMDKQFNVLD